MIIMRAIKPKAFKSSTFREEAITAAVKMEKAMLGDFEKTVETWNDPPKFKGKVESGASVGGVRVKVTTADPRYGYVDKGTKKHIIRPKNKRFLSFREGYIAKTKPRFIGSKTGGPHGNYVYTAKPVKHPGTKARKFTETIRKKYETEFRKEMKNALARAARRSGHGVT